MKNPFEIEQEAESRWCWAAVGVSVKRYFSPTSTLRQCELANKVIGDEKCCDRPLPHGLNRSEPLQDVLSNPDVDALKKTLPGIALPFEDIRTQIDASYPVCVRVGWPGQNSGHFIVIYGWGLLQSGEQWVDVADPFFGYWTIPYDQLVDQYQGSGIWTDTFLTEMP